MLGRETTGYAMGKAAAACSFSNNTADLNEADAAGADMEQVIFEGQAMFQDMSVDDE
jgi:hypothetical protein